MRRLAGYTLWELLCTVLVLGVVLGIGSPTLHTVILDSRRTAELNAFVLAVQVARSEAAKRAGTAVLCQSFDRLRCGGDELGYGAGWIVFANADGGSPPQRSSDEPLLLVHVPEPGLSIAGNQEVFEFRPFLKRSTNGTLVFCDERGTSAARAVIVSYTGRPRVDSVDPARNPLVCGDSS